MPAALPQKPVPVKRPLRRPVNRRFFLLWAAAAGLPLAMPGFFGRSSASAAGRAAIPPVDRAAPSVTRTATFAMG